MLAVCSLAGAAWGTAVRADSPPLEPRVALVIGNSAYGAEIGNLANPANDAKLMAASLRKVGFDVIELEDADQQQMRRAIADFGDALAKAGSAATGLFFYAGHGLQVAGDNYLIPIKADIRRENDVDVEAVPSDSVLKQMDFAGNAVNIVILDACRNNPLARGFRSQTRGLAEIRTKPRGSFIAYSTAPGDVAADGAGADSPYTLALSQAILKPGAGLEEVFRDVRSRVLAATNQKQVPWDSSSLTAPFYFVPAAQTAAAEPAAPAVPAAPAASGDSKAVEVAYWNSIANSANPALFQSYLKRFPNGDFTELAEAKLADLQQASGDQKTRTTETASAAAGESGGDSGIDELDASYVAKASANVRAKPSTDSAVVAKLAADDGVNVTGKVRDKAWLRVRVGDVDGYVTAPLLAPADAAEIADWHELKPVPKPDAVQAFLTKYPDGYFKPKAEALLAALQAPAAAAPAPVPAAPAAEAPAAETPAPSGKPFRDCRDCPEMVSIPAGAFVMGSPEGEVGRIADEAPQHRVVIAKAFAAGKFEVTVAEFRAFIQQSGYDAGNSCYTDAAGNGTYASVAGATWQSPGFAGYTQSERNPVVCVDWNGAVAYTAWLSQHTGKRYRLLSEAEWEYAARAGSTTPYPWGNDATPACSFSNALDATARSKRWIQQGALTLSCDDGTEFTGPVGRYRPNAFGLYDMIGNANEWVGDCYAPSYAAAPADGAVADIAGCQQRVVRGGGWSSNPYLLRSAARTYCASVYRLSIDGFRVAREL